MEEEWHIQVIFTGGDFSELVVLPADQRIRERLQRQKIKKVGK
ncbi:MAG: hypothetical protein K0Q77_758 [Anaerosporomusa subterranea]|jgi:hypothetical protein|nr:hypothetical protein [Anaerosporomusa subterranea]